MHHVGSEVFKRKMAYSLLRTYSVPVLISALNFLPIKHWSIKCWFKGSLQWKNDLGLYFSLVLVLKIGMYDLVIYVPHGGF